MSRITIVNIVLGVVCVGLLSWLYYLETSDNEVAPAVTSTTSSSVAATTVPTTVPATTTTTSTTTTTTSTTTTTVATTVPPSTEVPIERFFVGVLVVNGTSTGQRLAPVVERLSELGYFDVRGVVGAVAATATAIYYADGYLGEASVVAVDLGFEIGGVEILGFDDLPPVSGRGEAKVIVYLGPDVIPEPPAPDEAPDESAE